MSNLVDRFVQAQSPPDGGQPSMPVPKLSLALVPYAVVFGALAWVGSHLAEMTWDYANAPPARSNPRRRRAIRRREPEPPEEAEDDGEE